MTGLARACYAQVIHKVLMTAEIAILNKMAVALAADSAVTVETDRGSKIYNSTNKLFVLSKYQPVGIMVYGLAEFMGVPWETIIKIYRKRLSKRTFATVVGYGLDFLGFLNGRNPLFPQTQQDQFFSREVTAYFRRMKSEIDNGVEALIRRNGRVTDAQIRRTVASTIGRTHRSLTQAATLACFEHVNRNSAVRKYEQRVMKIRAEVFEQLPISRFSERRLRQIAVDIFLKESLSASGSGVVVAGFGDEACFPALQHTVVDGIFEGIPRHRAVTSVDVAETGACIVPFAQSEMVHTFMEGVDPHYQTVFQEYLAALFDNYPRRIARALPKVTKREKQDFVDRLKALGRKLLEEFEKQTAGYRRENHVRPVIGAVGLLPMDELAAMAESLVNLTSFKRRISMEAETVGGPIDVAVISKGDGFVWIKRKHYFKPELNPGFFANYYREDDEKQEEEKNVPEESPET